MLKVCNTRIGAVRQCLGLTIFASGLVLGAAELWQVAAALAF